MSTVEKEKPKFPNLREMGLARAALREAYRDARVACNNARGSKDPKVAAMYAHSTRKNWT